MNRSVMRRLERGGPLTMLGVGAHPDDEAYLSATLITRVVAAGGSVVLVTVTRGELGSSELDCDRARFAVLRERELRSAMGLIGVADVRFLGLADGACGRRPDTELLPTTMTDERGRKAQALDAHASQTSPLVDLVGRAAFHGWWRHETFRLPTVADVLWAAEPAVLVGSGAR
jgi:LmbE family N-acetylglucosaminyl deacetylase